MPFVTTCSGGLGPVRGPGGAPRAASETTLARRRAKPDLLRKELPMSRSLTEEITVPCRPEVQEVQTDSAEPGER